MDGAKRNQSFVIINSVLMLPGYEWGGGMKIIKTKQTFARVKSAEKLNSTSRLLWEA